MTVGVAYVMAVGPGTACVMAAGTLTSIGGTGFVTLTLNGGALAWLP